MSCNHFPNGHRFCVSKSNVQDYCWFYSHSLRANSRCFVTRFLLDRGNCIGCCDIRVHNSPGVCHVALYCNASASFAPSTAFVAAVCPTVAGCFAPRCSYDPHAPSRLSVSQSESTLVARLPGSLEQNIGPCWLGAFLHLQQRDRTSLSALCETSDKLFETNPYLLYCRHLIPLANC